MKNMSFFGSACFFAFKIQFNSQTFITLLELTFFVGVSKHPSEGEEHSHLSQPRKLSHILCPSLFNLANTEIRFFLLWDFS